MNSSENTDAVMQVIVAETNAFWMKDFAAWADCWLHVPEARIEGWWARGGITIDHGWETISTRIQEVMQANPTPNPKSAGVRRENVNIRTSEQMAWVTFDQYGADTGEPDMDMPGLSHETRILEKQDGQWKIVFASWLLEGN